MKRWRRKNLVLYCWSLVLWTRAPNVADSLQFCSNETGSGKCPTGNTCCLLPDEQTGCIPSDLGSYNATCCPGTITGCGVGYFCVDGILSDGGDKEQICWAGPTVTDPLVQRLPRYILSEVTRELTQLRGFPIASNARLPYYSTHGDIPRDLSGDQGIRVLLVVIHGAGRNADDYYSSMKSAISIQKVYKPSEVLLIAPRFPLMGDIDLDYPDNMDGSVNTSTALRWAETAFGGGGWRYGADSVAPDQGKGISSFAALDWLVGNVTRRLGVLDRVILAGHSSGGQFVQRYALLTPNWESNYLAFVANPSSFAYLWPLRYSTTDGSWCIPNFRDCPVYNEWEWGLEVGREDKARYFEEKVIELGIPFLSRRFSRRYVVYAAGGLDVCNVSGTTDGGWCNSHGLETTCGDMLQGSNRWERHRHYISSLDWIHHNGRHQSIVIPGVGHDHSLVFQSGNALNALFGHYDVSELNKIMLR